MRRSRIPATLLSLSLTISALTAIPVPALAASAGSAHAASHTQESTPTFDDCYRLAWVRGVHVELGELGSFNESCMANQVPFDTGNPADSVQRDTH